MPKLSLPIQVRGTLTALCLGVLVVMAHATPLNSVVTGGGTFSLNPGITYQGGIFVTSNTIIEGNGATINLALGSGLPRNMGVNTGVSLTLRNVTLRNGDGVLTQPGAFFTGEGITFQNCTRAVFVNTGASISLSSCAVSGHTVDAVGVNGGTAVLTNVSITGGQGVLVQNAGVLVWNGGSATSVVTAVNVLASGAQVNLNNLTFTACREALIAQGFQRVDVANCQVVNHQATTNAFFFGNSAGVVTMNNVTIAGQGLSQQGEGVLLQNLSAASEPVQINNVTVRDMRGGVVAMTVTNLSVSGCRLYQNHKNQLNIQYVSNALVQNTYLRGRPVRGTINIEDFDTLFVRASTITVRDCVILDSPDTGILSYESNVTLVGTFIAGPRTFCIAADRDEEQNRFVGSTLLAVDCTFINAQLQNVYISPQSTGTVLRCLMGYTTNRQSFPSTPSQPVAQPPFEGTCFHATTAQFALLQSLIYQPVQFGIQVNSLTSSALTGQGQVRWCTVAGVPGVTREGVIYQNAGPQHEFRDNHVFGINGTNRRGVLTDRVVTLTSMANSWLGNPGDIGLLQNDVSTVNASSCYFGHPSGPSGLYGGSGSQVVGNAARINVSGHLASPPLASVVGTVAVNGSGVGTATLDTGRLRVAMTYEAEAFTRPDDNQTAGFTGIIGLTDYRIAASAPSIDTAPMVANEVRRVANLWIDRRLALLPQSVVPRLTLDISMPDLANPIQSARIAWVVDGALRTQNASQLSGLPTVARFVFEGAANFPTSTISLSFVEGTVEPPTISITSPSGNQTVGNSTTSLAFSGTASAPGSSVTRVEWRNNGGSWTNASGTTSWSFTATSLAVGSNLIEVRSVNSAGLTSSIASRTITREAVVSPDRFEPNDTQAQATLLALNVPGFTDVPNLSMGSDGVDWYEINVPALTHLSIDIVYDPSLGALSADLWDRRGVSNPLSFGLPVAQDYRGTGTSRLVYVNTTAPERLYLRVFGPANPAYAMMIETIVEDDQYDVGGIDNNSPCAPSIIPTIAVNTMHRNLVLRDDDWYRVQLPPGTTELDVRVAHGFFSGDLNVMVIGDDPADCAGAFGRIIAGGYGTGPGDDEVLSGVNVTGRTNVLIRVYGANLFMRNIYDLHLTTR